MTAVHVLGIRHHGPGSARSVAAALDALAPDCVLVEGPPDADGVLALAAHADMRPPVALLVYAPEAPRKAVYYPFAAFSPEWVAIRWALGRGVPVRFMDLPVAHGLALDDEADAARGETVTAEGEDGPTLRSGGGPPRRDPLQLVAEAAGYADGERWWERMVEERRDHAGVFEAVLHLMTVLREELPEEDPDEARREALREAHMRQVIRAALKEGHARVAVVCGAWHAPALATLPPAKGNAALLKGLPRLKVQTTWIPWTPARLARESGYGAGVDSPGWYAHLWAHGATGDATVAWMTRVARLLRDEDVDASPAQVIDAVRLATTLAALRGRAVAGLDELTEATLAALLGGVGAPLALVRDRLVVGVDLGAVPDEAPMVPLQASLAAEQKRLRLKPEASQKALDLDLRQPTDLERSTLLHRLNLLDVPWGAGERAMGKGTFREAWRLEWRPELAVRVIEAAAWGNTVADAAAARAAHLARTATDLPALSQLLGRLLLADVPQATRDAIARLDELAAVSSDFAQLCEALPPVARALRYGDVRGTDQALLAHVVAGLVARIAAGLPVACGSLDDAAADAMYAHVSAVHDALGRLQDAELTARWHEAMQRVLARGGVHGLVAGRCGRLLLDAHVLGAAEVEAAWASALSPGTAPDAAAAWVEGFLRDSGTILVHDATLWALLDGWLASLAPDAFTAALPLLRRTVGTFTAPERRQLGARAAAGAGRAAAPAGARVADAAFDAAGAAPVVRTVARLLGITLPDEEGAHA